YPLRLRLQKPSQRHRRRLRLLRPHHPRKHQQQEQGRRHTSLRRGVPGPERSEPSRRPGRLRPRRRVPAPRAPALVGVDLRGGRDGDGGVRVRGSVEYRVREETEAGGDHGFASGVISSALFGNNFESFLVEKTTNIDVREIKRLKALLGGSG
ncbi:hypothetical protein LINPERPRIM_LOCUS34382, partial [Linum perenne]